jgi:hypothetical protein
MARPRLELPPHGTRRRYQHRTDPCRLGCCTEANARYIAGRRAVRNILAGHWTQLELPAGFLPRPVMVGCTHSLQTIGERCSWCGNIAHTVAAVPGVLVSA